ncbi:MAG: NUDIX domain-containing protein [Candidatus Cloacimonadaceae bacterium]|nr:NUDIX domain-containing protein [Candidatus Cloacimonadaceae bacterium]
MDKTLYDGINYCLACGARLLVTTDREGKLRPGCQACGWVYYKNPVPAVAVVVLNEANQILLIKRRFAPQAGEWALPSGYMEVTLSPEENALEELLEETGLIGEISHCIGWHYGSSPLYHRILNLGFRVCVTGGTLQAGDDAEEALFVELDALPPIAFASHRKFINLETGTKLPLDYH